MGWAIIISFISDSQTTAPMSACWRWTGVEKLIIYRDKGKFVISFSPEQGDWLSGKTELMSLILFPESLIGRHLTRERVVDNRAN